MILHLMNDEKVIDNTIDNFEAAFPKKNKFIILFNPKKGTPRYVKSKNASVFFLRYNSKEFWQEIGDISFYKHIIIHFLCPNKVNFINRIDHNSITWSVWGADLYTLTLEPKGYNYFQVRKKKTFNIYKAQDYIRNTLTTIVRRLRLNTRIKAIKKINYFVGNKYSLEILSKLFPSINGFKYKHFSYYSLEDFFGESFENIFSIGNSIVIGNSAHSSGNHQFAIEVLSKFDLKKRKIIVPLSYPRFLKKDDIIEAGHNLLGNNFEPITEFMPLVEYNKLLSKANVFIFANIRGQAMGNILVALFLGAKVFLNLNNPMLPYLRDMGFTIFSIDDLSQEQIDTTLDSISVSKNKKIILDNYTKSKLVLQIKKEFSM